MMHAFFCTVLCILNSVIQMWVFSVDSSVYSETKEEYVLLSRVYSTVHQ